jgi:hypothetical protein
MNEEFKFQVSGTAELLTFAEIDQVLKDMMQSDLDKIERRLVEIYDRREDHPSTGATEGHYGSIGKMRLKDILLKFR